VSSENHNGRRVVITGLGVVSAAGIGREAYWNSLLVGRSGIRRIDSFDVSSYECQVAGQVENFDPADFMPLQVARRVDKFAQFALAAATLAVKDGNLSIGAENPEKIGVVLGTSIGTLCYAEQQIALFYEKGITRINPFFATSVIPSSAVTQVMLNFRIKGASQTITTACASSTSAVGAAFHSIRDGVSDVILAGGSEAPITPLVLATLSSLHLLVGENSSPDGSFCPFSKDASGFVLGEGSGILLLEELDHARKRGAKIYGEVLGFGCSSDAYHVMFFDPAYEQPVAAIGSALAEARLEAGEVDYINAHGIAIPETDRGETCIFKKAFGETAYKIPISATKPLTGHTLGAGGALELIACCLMMDAGYLHPTINLRQPDPQCDLNYLPNVGMHRSLDTMMSVSFGFGGYNAACIIRKCDAG
jgi:3-oxoacyl-[acyl-carrier-protein] synthase II